MKALHSQIYKSAANPKDRILSIFIACQDVSDAEFDAALVEEVSRIDSPVAAIHFVGYDEEIVRVQGWLRRPDDVSYVRLRDLLGREERPLRFIAFDATQGRHVVTTLDGQSGDDIPLLRAEETRSLAAAFKRSGAEQQAPVGTHFVKTSHNHAERFLRVSNLLENSGNVQLVAFWLLPHLWPAGTRSVAVDTSSLFAVVLSAVIQALRLRGGASLPRVWSFQSYDGVDSIPHYDAASTLFVVSASTSGGLVKRLQSRLGNDVRVITLFSLSSDVPPGHVLCDLRDNGTDSLDLIRNSTSAECNECRRNFHSILISGDQFAIAPPELSLIEVAAKDLPALYRSHLSALTGLRVFHAFSRGEGETLRTLGADALPLLYGAPSDKSRALLSELRAQWASVTRRTSTLTLKTIVSCSYPGSDQLAADAARMATTQMQAGTSPQVVNTVELSSLAPAAGASAIVYSACIDSSKEFLSVSRALRDIQPDGNISYLVGLNLMSDAADAERLRTNITFGRYGARTFDYHCLLSLHADCIEERASWSLELFELQRAVDWADTREVDVPREILTRIHRLLAAPSTGLVDDLFWGDPGGAPLRLRSDFALLDDSLREPIATQADLFATIVITLSQLRRASDVKRRLACNAYQRTVLSPQNFARYSDGVLQACFLRAARGQELGYGACEADISEQMLDIMLDMLPQPAMPERTDALMEVLVALAIGRLTVHEGHLKQFMRQALQGKDKLSRPAQFMLEYLSERQ